MGGFGASGHSLHLVFSLSFYWNGKGPEKQGINSILGFRAFVL